LRQIHRFVNDNEYIGIFRNYLGCRQRAHKGNTLHSRTVARSVDEGSYGQKEVPTWLGNRRPWALFSESFHG
jgi:hypothetical protein